MDNFSKKQFINRLAIYNSQYILAFIFVLCVISVAIDHKMKNNEDTAFFIALFSIFNTVTYFCSKYFAQKYGINMFDDLDQNWLKENQGYGAEVFGEIFGGLLHCRKIAGPYMLLIFLPIAFINASWGSVVGILYIIGYLIYRDTYLTTALADRIPRAFGGGVVVSRVIDRNSSTTVK